MAIVAQHAQPSTGMQYTLLAGLPLHRLYAERDMARRNQWDPEIAGWELLIDLRILAIGATPPEQGE